MGWRVGGGGEGALHARVARLAHAPAPTSSPMLAAPPHAAVMCGSSSCPRLLPPAAKALNLKPTTGTGVHAPPLTAQVTRHELADALASKADLTALRCVEADLQRQLLCVQVRGDGGGGDGDDDDDDELLMTRTGLGQGW